MATASISTTSCFDPYLYSPKPFYQLYALKKLCTYVDTHWHEIIEHSSVLFDLVSNKTDESLSQFAAYILSKCHYYLCDYQTSVEYAMQSGNNFFLNTDIYYESTIATAAIDIFIEKTLDDSFDMSTFPAIHKEFVLKIIYKSLEHQFSITNQATVDGNKPSPTDMNMDIIGMIIEAELSDLLLKIFEHYSDVSNQNNSHILCSVCDYILYIILESHMHMPKAAPKWFLPIIHFFLEHSIIEVINVETLVTMLLYLRCPKTFMQVISAISSVDLQIQICLDVVGSAVPTFLHKLKEPELWENFPKQQNNLYLLHKILSGDVHSALMNRFLEKNAFKDVNKCLRRIKDASRHNVIHNAICITNGFLSYGTNDDKFLRDNMNWLSKFQCWSCFSASTTVGQIHYGNESNPIEILQAFLPQKNSQTTSNTTNNSSSPGSNHNYFSESGAYLALGLMAPGRNLDKINNYFIDEMDAAHASDFLLHGLSAGLGASAAFSHSPDILEKLKANLFLDETLVGQSSAISVGLVAAGGLDQFEDEFKELQEFSLQTSHEKIMLGCGLGQAMIVCLNPPLNDSVDHVMQFGENSNLDRIINNIEPSIRLGAVNCIAMAYAGTCNCNAIRLLLNLISDDVSDMVKRGAVIALGFIFLRRRSLAFDIIEPLLSHHNQHIRFGAALAFGVCFASTGSDRALTLLMSCQDQSAGFVNQAIYVAAGMVVNGNNSSTCSQYDIVTRWINLACLSAHESFSVKFGSIIALGLVNAGGQNVQISPFTNYGQLSVRKLSGLLIAMHYWFWYPLIQYFSLCFDPNHLILLDRNLDILDLQLQTDMPADAFAHMKIDVQGQNSIKSQFHTAVLSFVRDKNKLLNPISSSAQNTSTVESKISTVAPIENKEPGKSHKKVAAIQSDHSESDSKKSLSNIEKTKSQETTKSVNSSSSSKLLQSEAKKSKSSPSSQSTKKQPSKVIRTRQRSRVEEKDQSESIKNPKLVANTRDEALLKTSYASSFLAEEEMADSQTSNEFPAIESLEEDQPMNVDGENADKIEDINANATIPNFSRVLLSQRSKISLQPAQLSAKLSADNANYELKCQRDMTIGGIIVVSQVPIDSSEALAAVDQKEKINLPKNGNSVTANPLDIPILFNALDIMSQKIDVEEDNATLASPAVAEAEKNDSEPPKPFIFNPDQLE